MRRMLSHILVAVAVIGVASGCAGPTPVPTLPPEPTTTPVFATEEEALAAATQAYAEYQAVVDAALANLDPSELGTVATGVALEGARESVADLKASGRHQEGVSRVQSVMPLDLSGLVSAEPDTAQGYACLDVSGVTIVGGSESAGAPSQEVFPIVVTFQWDQDRLLVSEEDVWDGPDFCS